jgi:2-keto-4-pentenoate hydratase/2-oxohepta-3-ene-1,7-dioic acid hydratase in catechol pathway
MKLVRYGEPGNERPGLVDSRSDIRDLEKVIRNINSDTIASPQWCALKSVNPETLPNLGAMSKHRLGACVGNVGKIICIGLNEKSHSQQMGVDVQKEPIFFFKPTSSITGPSDPIYYPKVAQRVDWEAEIGIVIGKRCKYVSEKDARAVIAGFCIINDVSDRYWQLDKGFGQASTGKQFDTFAPLGPFLVTPDEMNDPDNLNIKTWVNGEERQNFNSSDYIVKVDGIVAYCSQLFTLYPGDVIAMGSGPGNGAFWGQFLKLGDVMKVEIDGLGTQENLIVTEP